MRVLSLTHSATDSIEITQQAQEDLAKKLASQSWWGNLPAVINNRIAIVDGRRMFSAAGPQLVDAYCFLVGWLTNAPQIIPDDFPWKHPPA